MLSQLHYNDILYNTLSSPRVLFNPSPSFPLDSNTIVFIAQSAYQCNSSHISNDLYKHNTYKHIFTMPLHTQVLCMLKAEWTDLMKTYLYADEEKPQKEM